MTPLFSQSQNLPQSSQESLSQVVLSSQDGSATGSREAHMIRAIFASTLTQTQDTMTSFTQASQESTLFAMSRRPTRPQREATTQDSMTVDDSTVPRRRIFQANAAKSQIIRGVMNANRRREARAKQQATERGNKVHMMRRYRIGKGNITNSFLYYERSIFLDYPFRTASYHLCLSFNASMTTLRMVLLDGQESCLTLK